MRNLQPAEWRALRLHSKLTVDGDLVEWEKVRLDGVHHVVHDYANFLSSAEMVTTGQHLRKGFDPPVNTHLFHAFLLNFRKMADFFGPRAKEDDVIADDYVPGFTAPLPIYVLWREPVNKQLAHITYTRDVAPKEIIGQTCVDMHHEIKRTWKDFRSPARLLNPFAARFEQEITDILKSEFKGLDLW